MFYESFKTTEQKMYVASESWCQSQHDFSLLNDCSYKIQQNLYKAMLPL